MNNILDEILPLPTIYNPVNELLMIYDHSFVFILTN